VSPGDQKRLASLRVGLKFASGARRAEIQAMIGRLEAAAAAPAAAEASIADWRDARRRLRQAGHEVKQFDGVVYVDGRASSDPRLKAPA
jgi:hypothetical protein